MKKLNSNARGFIEGVVASMKKNGGSHSTHAQVRQYLHKISQQNERENIAHIDSAVTLSESEKQQLEGVVHGFIGRPILVDYHVHPGLIGGLRIRVGELILDTSLATQLEDLRVSLL